jgi:hypothetical protein
MFKMRRATKDFERPIRGCWSGDSVTFATPSGMEEDEGEEVLIMV